MDVNEHFVCTGESLINNFALKFQENNWNCCHEMSYSWAKMDQIRFRLGLCSRPHWGAHSAPPTP